MIEKEFYFSSQYEKAKKLCGLADDEIESIVGRFRKNSWRAGQLRGKVVELIDGQIQIRESFGGRLLWPEQTKRRVIRCFQKFQNKRRPKLIAKV